MTAYVSHGRWVADCPAGCGNAIAVLHGNYSYRCDPGRGGCGATIDVIMPPDADEIWGVLARRPAVTCGGPLFPCGGCARNWRPPETVTQLLAENVAGGV